MYRFFIGRKADELQQDAVLTMERDGAVVEQLVKVLRAKPGDGVVLVPFGGVEAAGARAAGAAPGPYFDYSFRVVEAHKKEVRLRFESRVENGNELGFGLGLVLCVPNKPDKLSFILQKAVELGVGRVDLVTGDFSQMKHGLREDRLGAVMREAAEQAERAVLPEMVIGGSLREFLKRFGDGGGEKGRGVVLAAVEREDVPMLGAVLDGVDVSGGVRVVVGPEGGFSEEEKEMMRGLEADGILRCFSLGPRILRMETAAILALGTVGMRSFS